jgi:hypothetical protein
MDIPNLSSNPITPTFISKSSIPPKKNKGVFVIIIVLSIGLGFLLSRIIPLSSEGKSLVNTLTEGNVTSADQIKNSNDIVVGKSYGETGKSFKDTATGTIVAGGINGEGTHTLQREGKNQNAALTSSVLDLDLFIGKKVEIKGETNTSKKAGWLLDVGVVKILE